MELDAMVIEVLNYLESIEAKYLSWGYADGGFSYAELTTEVEEYTSKIIDCSYEADEIIERLYLRKLIIEDPYRKVWRTRMAETMRLLSSLRQWMQRQSWRVAKTLVGDFRFLAKPRLFPVRNVSTSDALSHLSGQLTDEQVIYFQALVPDSWKLAAFQLKATESMIRDLKVRDNRGMIVSAHTGTGKTLAFYIPAILETARLAEDGVHSTKVLALYPRSELLKDQLVEAYLNCRRLDVALVGKRKLTIGAYYGETPPSSKRVKDKNYYTWQRTSSGFLCPFFRCPVCGSTMVWRERDVDKGEEKLYCTDSSCGHQTNSDEVMLTRSRMLESPPDILFTTTEMLNRSLSDPKARKLFGISVQRPPRMVLLDEVHTYTGTHGAQVGLLLRRWRNMVGTNVHFTGLSATLRDANEFFSQVTGLQLSKIRGIEMGNDLEQKGQEYQVILRGDPSSGASLLSTSIQAGMLMRRMLDVSNTLPSGGLFGQKVFMFTDDLDVTNRLFHNLLDAEGRYSNGGIRPDKAALASFRATSKVGESAGELRDRFLAGQSWLMVEEIGHNPDGRLEIGRTSSQDKGVLQEADIIVATATLEVGYNDSTVGAVIQHKSPQDFASFLQRKGRAGRKSEMRPWTVTVLSDYGRDRTTFQAYESLFYPVLPKRTLPLSNRYILKMQAVFCLFDWLCTRSIHQGFPTSIWQSLSGPTDDPHWRAVQVNIANELKLLVTETSIRQQFEDFLKRSLDMEDDILESVMWEAPRSIMFSVLPSLSRRLQRNWKTYTSKGYEYYASQHPAPEFVPTNLFTELNSHQVEIEIEQRTRRNGYIPPAETTQMPLLQALNMLSPGRVTRRFDTHSARDNHWVPIDLSNSDAEQLLDIATYMLAENIGDVQVWTEDGTCRTMAFVRPWTFTTSLTPDTISPTSNSRLEWRSQIFPESLLVSNSETTTEAQVISVPSGLPWASIVKEIRPYTHTYHSPVSVRRFAIGAEASIRHKRGRRTDYRIRFVTSEENFVAVGFQTTVDGIAFVVNIPEEPFLMPDDANQGKVRAFRAALFRHIVDQDQRLDGLLNIFERERISEAYLSALIATAMQQECSLRQARDKLQRLPLRQVLHKVLTVIFQSGDNESDDEDSSDENNSGETMVDRLLSYCGKPELITAIYEAADCLFEEPTDVWHRWARERLRATLGAALLRACKEIAGPTQSTELYLDLDIGPSPTGVLSPRTEIYITEMTGGGCGVIEEVVEQIQDDPRRFFRLVENTLEPSDFEYVDSELRRCLNILPYDEDLQDMFAQIRGSVSYQEIGNVVEDLPRYMSSKGILATQTVMNSLYTRILKAGSSPITDKLISDLLTLWDTYEKQLGLEIDGRVFAYVCSTWDTISEQFALALAHLDPQVLQDGGFRFQTIYSLLWLRGYQVRKRSLEYYNPFTNTVLTDPQLLKDYMTREREVDLSDPGWFEKATTVLGSDGTLRLTASLDDVQRLNQAILYLAAQPTTLDFLHVYPRVEGITREYDRYVVTLDIREVVD